MAAAAARAGSRWSPAGAASTRCLDRPHGGPLGPGDPHRRGELGLPAGPVEEHDQPAGDRLGDVPAEVLVHQGQGQVDPGGDPGAGPVLPVTDVDGVGVDLEAGVLGGQLSGRGPVRGDPSAVEQAGLGGDERSGAHRGHPPAPGRGSDDPRHQGRRRNGPFWPDPHRAAPGCRSPRWAGEGVRYRAPHRYPNARALRRPTPDRPSTPGNGWTPPLGWRRRRLRTAPRHRVTACPGTPR